MTTVTLDPRLIIQLELMFQMQTGMFAGACAQYDMDPEDMLIRLFTAHRDEYRKHAQEAAEEGGFFAPTMAARFAEIDEYFTDLLGNVRNLSRGFKDE